MVFRLARAKAGSGHDCHNRCRAEPLGEMVSNVVDFFQPTPVDCDERREGAIGFAGAVPGRGVFEGRP